MGQAKHEIEVREENWKMKAESEGWKCAVCGATPIYDERDVFFDTDMCGPCANTMSKDD